MDLPAVLTGEPLGPFKTKKPPKHIWGNDLGTLDIRKFDVSAYGVMTYDKFFSNLAYLTIANAVPNLWHENCCSKWCANRMRNGKKFCQNFLTIKFPEFA
jgi:hypothetical protein